MSNEHSDLSHTDLLIVGAGPAGMAAAVTARQHGLSVRVVDDQPAPGGQIWRAVETVAATPRLARLGEAYRAGVDRAAAFRAWKPYLGKSQPATRPIVWSKTTHEMPDDFTTATR